MWIALPLARTASCATAPCANLTTIAQKDLRKSARNADCFASFFRDFRGVTRSSCANVMTFAHGSASVCVHGNGDDAPERPIPFDPFAAADASPRGSARSARNKSSHGQPPVLGAPHGAARRRNIFSRGHTSARNPFAGPSFDHQHVAAPSNVRRALLGETRETFQHVILRYSEGSRAFEWLSTPRSFGVPQDDVGRLLRRVAIAGAPRRSPLSPTLSPFRGEGVGNACERGGR